MTIMGSCGVGIDTLLIRRYLFVFSLADGAYANGPVISKSFMHNNQSRPLAPHVSLLSKGNSSQSSPSSSSGASSRSPNLAISSVSNLSRTWSLASRAAPGRSPVAEPEPEPEPAPLLPLRLPSTPLPAPLPKLSSNLPSTGNLAFNFPTASSKVAVCVNHPTSSATQRRPSSR